jgi:hypothetical protein
VVTHIHKSLSANEKDTCLLTPFTLLPLFSLFGITQSFLIEISAIIANKKDEEAGGFLLDKIVDKTGAKGTGEAGGCCV